MTRPRQEEGARSHPLEEEHKMEGQGELANCPFRRPHKDPGTSQSVRLPSVRLPSVRRVRQTSWVFLGPGGSPEVKKKGPRYIVRLEEDR
jgi:hypothetical protein